MRLRTGRIRALIAAGAIAAMLIAAGVTVASAASTPAHSHLLLRCAKIIAGQGGRAASAVAGSADPQVAAELSIFRVTRTAADTLPAAGDLGHALARAHATTYDPSASVHVNLGLVKGGPLYAVPATLTAPSLPARCAHLRALAGLRAVFALYAQAAGTGPGVCLITTQLVPAESPVSILPGKRPGKRGKSHTVATANCESLTAMASYLGATGFGLTGTAPSVALVPDGVSSVTYAFSGAPSVTRPVYGNLVTIPESNASSVHLGTVSRAKLLRRIAALTPATVTETDASGAAVATYTRPTSLVPALANEVLLVSRLLKVVVSSGSQQVFASCSAQTHRCVAAVVSTRCDSRHHRCTMHRTVHRYRYVGRRPPRGTTGTVEVPTGRIRARVSQYVTRPGKVNLVLRGTPHHHADVVVATSCYAGHHGATRSAVDRQPLRVAVPSHSRIATVRRHRTCAVNVLVTSTQPGPIHARLARG